MEGSKDGSFIDGSSMPGESLVFRGGIYLYDSDSHILKKMKLTRFLLPTDNNVLRGRFEADDANHTS